MCRLTYLVFQGLLLLISLKELPIFQNAAKHQVDARMKVKYACQNHVMSIRCLSSKVIKIVRATYLRKNPQICSGDGFNSTEYCSPVVKTSVMRKLCDKQATCNVSVDQNTMGDHCPFVYTEYLNVIYKCQTPPPTTEPTLLQNKATTVLTKPPTPSPPLNETPNEEPTERDVFLEDDEDYSSPEVVGFIIFDGASIHTNSAILGVLMIFAVAIL